MGLQFFKVESPDFAVFFKKAKPCGRVSDTPLSGCSSVVDGVNFSCVGGHSLWSIPPSAAIYEKNAENG